MSEVKEIHIKAEIEEVSADTETSTDDEPAENKEKNLATRMREIAEGAIDTVKSEVKKEIEERVLRGEKTATDLKSEVKKEVEAIVQRAQEQYESEREDLLREEIEKEVETAVQQVHDEYQDERDRLLRTAAEAENTKKRLQTDYQRQLKYANEGILEGMVPVLDSLEAAIKSVAEKIDEADVSPTFTSLNEGVQLVHKQLLDALKIHGLEPIEAVGETFDPNQHEALLVTASDDVLEGKIIEEFRRGYMLHTRVLRASQVVVSQGPAEVEEEETPNDVSDDDTETTDAVE